MPKNKTCLECIHCALEQSEYPCNKFYGVAGINTHTDACPYWAPAPPAPKGVTVRMTCGEEHFYGTNQPTVEFVKFNGEVLYPPTLTPESEPYVFPVDNYETLTISKPVKSRRGWTIRMYDGHRLVSNPQGIPGSDIANSEFAGIFDKYGKKVASIDLRHLGSVTYQKSV